MTITPFRFEPDLFERFLAVEPALYAGDPVWQHLPRRDVRAPLLEGNPFFAQGGEHRNFLALQGDEPRGRITAMTSPRLEGGRLGLVGFFECARDPALGAALIEAALGWLRERGAARALGPLNFSTWYHYRFVSGGRENGPFLLEPYDQPWYPDMFQAAGFVPFQEYASIRIPHTPVTLLEQSYRRAEQAGVRFEELRPEHAEAQLPLFYELSRRIFAGKTAYSAIGHDEFQALYQGMSRILVPGLSHVAFDRDDRAVGFLFAYPDLLEPLRKGDPSAPIETTVLKTLAIDPEGPRGLGWALCHLHIETCRAQGFRYGIYALMEKFEGLLRFSRHGERMLGGETGAVFKRYTLYARDL